MRLEITKLEISNETDVVKARQRAKQVAKLMAFDPQDQTRIATAVSEIARTVFEKSKLSTVSFYLLPQQPQRLFIDVAYKGLVKESDLAGARKLMDQFESRTAFEETKLTVAKHYALNQFAASKESVEMLKTELGKLVIQDPIEEMRNQNQELLFTLNQLRENQEKLETLNLELENTNRGVVALYSELDEKAQALHVANQVKTRFLSNVTHEFRTPVNSIANVSRILLEGGEGPLNLEQTKGIEMIAQSAKTLSDMVNDLLDLAKVEAGRISVRPTEFTLAELFSTLNKLFKPFSEHHPAVRLTFVESAEIIKVFTDEGKLSQILRNLISNALKFTESGEVRVEVNVDEKGAATFSVSDTGIGIPEEDIDYIFDEFVQLESDLQQKNRGTGLGLPLARKLATVLGGDISVESQAGRGSTFRVHLPLVYAGPLEATYVTHTQGHFTQRKFSFLIIDDDSQDSARLNQLLKSHFNCNVLIAYGGREGLSIARRSELDLVFIDLIMPEISGLEVLSQLRSDLRTRSLPLIMHSTLALKKEELVSIKRYNSRFLSKLASDNEKLRKIREIINSQIPHLTKEETRAERRI